MAEALHDSQKSLESAEKILKKLETSSHEREVVISSCSASLLSSSLLV